MQKQELNTSSRKSIVERLRLGVAHYFVPKLFAIQYELGVKRWGRRRADAVCLSMKGELVIVEIKSCRSDYRSDKKWRSYLDCADRFYFIVLESDSAWLRNEDLGNAGILTVNDSGLVYVVRRAKKNTLAPGVRKEIIVRFAWRGAAASRRTMPRIRQQALAAEKFLTKGE